MRILELLILFVGLPVAFTRWVSPRLLLPAMVVPAILAAVYLDADPSAPPAGPPLAEGVLALVIAGCVAGTVALLIFVRVVMPARLFDFPRAAPGFWLLVMVLYPVFSALPQEVIWRWFFFHRYAEVFPSPILTSVASALLFGFAHIVMKNKLAVLITTVGGFLFSETYRLTGSLWLVVLEHSVLGNALFTVGLGEFLYAGSRTRAPAVPGDT